MNTATFTRGMTLATFIAGLILGSASAYDAQYSGAAKKNIVETAIAAGSFTTLVKALQAAGLDGTLRGEGPFTVFAPTDKAFGKLPAGALDDLLKAENRGELRDILTYHVVPGTIPAARVITLQSAKTVQGQSLTIRVDNGLVMVDDAQVVTTDIMASNGVIHVIDTVVMPKQR